MKRINMPALNLSLASAIMAVGNPSLTPNFDPLIPKVEPEPPKHKCKLPSCQEMTDQEYCCAEHCREHSQLLKAANIARQKKLREMKYGH